MSIVSGLLWTPWHGFEHQPIPKRLEIWRTVASDGARFYNWAALALSR